MKSLFWKIIALVSVFAGSLGPQIATGSQVVTESVPVSIEQPALIPVITAASDVSLTVTESTDDCASSSFQLGRFDLLLWSDCDASLALGTVETHQDVIMAAPQAWPELTVETGPHKSITSTYDIWVGSGSIIGAFAYQATLETKTKSSFSTRLPSLVTQSYRNAVFASDNSQESVVLRC